MDVSSRLRDEVDVVSGDDDLVLLSLRFLNGNTFKHLDVSDTLLSQEVTIESERRVSFNRETSKRRRINVPDLDGLLVVGDDDVDGEMGVDETHLVGETESNTLDHVLDLGSDGAKASNVLASSVPDDKLDLVDGGKSLLRGSDDTHRHVDMLSVLLEGGKGSKKENWDNVDYEENEVKSTVTFERGGYIKLRVVSANDPKA